MKRESATVKKARFGVEEMLKASARVVYENIFSTRHVGRVIDFFLHECRQFIATSKDPGSAEYRIRHMLELAIFNGWSNYRRGEKAKCVEVELGWDDETLAIAVSHYADSDVGGFLPSDTKPAGPASARMARMFRHIQALSDGLVIRHSPELGRVQAIAFVQADSDDSEKTVAVDYVDLTGVPADEAEGSSATVPTPLSLGDVSGFGADEKADEQQRSGRRKPQINAPIDTDTKVEGGAEAAGDDTQTVSGTGDADVDSIFGGEAEASTETSVAGIKEGEEDKTRVSGAVPEESSEEWLVKASKGALGGDVQKASGGAAEGEEELVRIKGGNKLTTNEKIVVKGGVPDKTKSSEIQRVKGMGVPDAGDMGKLKLEALPEIKGMEEGAAAGLARFDETPTDAAMDVADKLNASNETEETEESMQVLLDTIKSEIAPLCPDLSSVQFQEAFRNLAQKIRENYTQTLHHLLRVKNIQTIAKVKHYKEQVEVLSGRIEELKGERLDLISRIEKFDATEAEILKLKAAADPVQQIEKQKKEDEKVTALLTEYQRNLESGEAPPQAQVWARGLMEATLKERALLTQKMRSVDAHLRKREHDFKSKETSFKEQMRIKDEQVRQKDFSLVKTKESLTNTLASLEKHRSLAKGGAAGQADLIHKLAASDKLLEVAKENNERMQKRVEELQKKWHEESASRATIQKEASQFRRKYEELQKKAAAGSEDTSSAVIQVTQQRDQALKVIDELKRQIQELQGKLGTASAMSKVNTVSSDIGKKGAVVTDAELKHKLEHSNKLVKSMKEELERTRKRFEEVKQEETKLRVEVAKLQGQLKAAGKLPMVAPPAPQKHTSHGTTKPIQPKAPKPGPKGGKP